ncbi:peptidase domain-containing ABC transporter [Micromonospora sp. DT228]|uniref:peptidase domain-containing ABC transporter n=1 Tax=Micromonospora sp. DT228 TaxID=3393443 RepID=UPI003CF2F13C
MVRRRIRLVEQIAQTECGLCCSAMLLNAAGLPVSIHDLRSRYTVGRDGLTVADLVRVLTSEGGTPHVYRTTTAGVAALGRPAICHWQQSHYVVVLSNDRRGATLLDPGNGRRRVSAAEFAEGFSGLAITVDHGVAAYPSTRRRPLLASFAFAQRGRLTLALVVSLVSALLPLGIPQLLAGVLGGTTEYGTGLLLLGAGLAFTLVMFLRTVVAMVASVAVGRSLSVAVFDRLLRLPYDFCEVRSTGDLLFTLDSVHQLRSVVCTDLVQALVGSVLAAVLLGWLGTVSLSALVVTFGLVVGTVLLTLGATTLVRRFSLAETRARAQLQSTQVSAIAGLEAIRTNGMEDTYLRRWSTENNRVLRHFAALQAVQGAITAATAGVMFIGPIAVLTAITHARGGQVDAATLVSVQALSAVLLSQVSSVVSALSRSVQSGALLHRVEDVLLRPADDRFQGTVRRAPAGDIEVDNVTFAYGTFARPVLRGASLRVPAGAKVAIVGPSGCGKSTLARLLVGLHRPTTGQIRIGGHDIGDYDRNRFYDAIAYVPQNVELGHGTIRDNIVWGCGDVDDARVLEAAGQVGLHEQVDALPLGYHTPVAALGKNFSGGQRQRIALARAALKRASIVVLDEATSSLDNVSQSLVTSHFDDLGTTRVVIAHRLTSVVDADLIVVMRDGEVVEAGTHDDLCARGGLYLSLYASDGPDRVLVPAGGRTPSNGTDGAR